MKFHLIRDSTQKEMILEKIYNNIDTAKRHLKLNRVDMYFINLYFQVSEKESIYFKLWKPSKHGTETLKKEKDKRENEI